MLNLKTSNPTSFIFSNNHQLTHMWWEPAPSNKYPAYDSRLSDGEAPGMRSTPSLPSLPGPLWPGVVASDRVLYLG